VIENVDRRILGAFRCVDAVTQAAVTGWQATSRELDIRRNASGTFVVFDGPGFHSLTTQFEVTDPWPAPRSLDVALTGPDGRYFSRQVQVKVPRKLAALPDPDSILVPQDVPLYLAPAAPLSPNWAVIRLSVTAAATKERLPWVVAQVTRDSDHAVLATGMGDDKGELLLAVPGLAVTPAAQGGGAVVQTTVAATVKVVFDSALRSKLVTAINPDLTLADFANPTLKTASQAVMIGRGTSEHFPLSISL
jgi:hypothetical protein